MDVLLVVLDSAKIRYAYSKNETSEKIAFVKNDISQENFDLIKIICEKRGYLLSENDNTVFIEN